MAGTVRPAKLQHFSHALLLDDYIREPKDPLRGGSDACKVIYKSFRFIDCLYVHDPLSCVGLVMQAGK